MTVVRTTNEDQLADVVNCIQKAFKVIVQNKLSPTWFAKKCSDITAVYFVPAPTTVLRSRTVQCYSAFACLKKLDDKRVELVVIYSSQRGLGTQLISEIVKDLPSGTILHANDVLTGTEPFYVANGFKVDGTTATRLI